MSESRGQVEFLAAVMDLVHAPEQGDLVAGAVKPVVAQVHEESGQHPGDHTVPGQVHQAVVVVDPGVDGDHGALGDQPHHGHQEAAGDARHAVRQVMSLTQPQVNHGLEDDEGDHVRHGLLHIVGALRQAGEGAGHGVDDVEQLAILLCHLAHR